MDMKLNRHSRGKRKKGDTAQLAARLAPLEELDHKSAAKQLGPGAQGEALADPHSGAIVVDNDSLNLPKDIMEGSSGGGTFLGMEPVVLVILGVMLAFIAFIAWQISQMPLQQ